MEDKIALLKKIFAIVCEAASLGRRSADDITLIAVSKTKPAAMISDFRRAGIKDFGENYVQEFLEKYEVLKEDGIRWHFIGTLQTNKVKYIVDKVFMIHTLDSIKLAEEIQKQAEKKNISTVRVLIQVNAGKEAQKGGIMPENLASFYKELQQFERLSVRGLMTIPPFLEPEEVRPYFQKLREMQRALIYSEKLDPSIFSELSMGMSNDFDVAIEEGATMVRVGSLLFGER